MKLNKLCCIKMESCLEEFDTPLHYEPYTRSYYIEYRSSFTNTETKEEIGITEPLFYCPWCGTKLPKDLMDEWMNIVEEKFGVTDTLDREQLKKIPKEYMTEEWWKKLGL